MRGNNKGIIFVLNALIQIGAIYLIFKAVDIGSPWYAFFGYLISKIEIKS